MALHRPAHSPFHPTLELFQSSPPPLCNWSACCYPSLLTSTAIRCEGTTQVGVSHPDLSLTEGNCAQRQTATWTQEKQYQDYSEVILCNVATWSWTCIVGSDYYIDFQHLVSVMNYNSTDNAEFCRLKTQNLAIHCIIGVRNANSFHALQKTRQVCTIFSTPESQSVL